MPANTIGERLRMTLIGESHGRLVGAVLDGVPAGLDLSEEDIQPILDLRRPGVSALYSARREPDKIEILSGVYKGRTTGAPITLVIWNKDVVSKPYEELALIPRPGHADYTAWVKYGGYNDPRGGGRFSGRLTAAMTAGGAVALKLLKTTLGIEVLAYTVEIGGVRAKTPVPMELIKRRYESPVRCPDPEASEKMVEKVLEAKRSGDSLGGIIECVSLNVPPGLGEPVVDTLDGDLSKAMFAIPAVKGIEFGAGFELARMRGSESNDEYTVKDGKVVTRTNNAGGILGGISNGMPLVFRVVFKPPSSIPRKQKSVRLDTLEEVEIVVKGRHDPCVVPRAVPVVEAMTAFVLADHAIRAGLIPPVLEKA